MFRFLKAFFYPDTKFYRSLKNILGFAPRNISYYETAFIHKSASFSGSDGSVVNNERLEFLGDAILDAVVADFLFHKFPTENEGWLTQMRSKIVNGEKLHELARKMGITNLIISHTDNSISKKHIYGDAFEAFIGAIYLDRGYDVTAKYIVHHIIKNFVDLSHLENTDTNYKSKLIEWGQKFKREIEFYTDFESPNSKYFLCYVRVDTETFGSGIGLSKKQAEQKAAKETLVLVGAELNGDWFSMIND